MLAEQQVRHEQDGLGDEDQPQRDDADSPIGHFSACMRMTPPRKTGTTATIASAAHTRW